MGPIQSIEISQAERWSSAPTNGTNSKQRRGYATVAVEQRPHSEASFVTLRKMLSKSVQRRGVLGRYEPHSLSRDHVPRTWDSSDARTLAFRHALKKRQSPHASHGLPYVVEVEYDGSAILGQPRGMELTPANDVLLYLFPRDLRPRHFAGESAHEPRTVSLHDSTMSKGEVRMVIVLFREIYFEYRSRLGVWHLAPALRPVPGEQSILSSLGLP